MGEVSKNCIILGGGEILDYAAVSRLVSGGMFVICADGGFKHCAGLGLVPGLIVGDFDSIKGEIPQEIPLVTLSPEKDYTDTDLAVKEALARGYNRLLMAGMTGGRPDHTLANIQILAGLSVSGVHALLTDGVTDYRAFTAPVQGNSFTIPPKAGHYFSVFALGGVCKRLNIQGAKYPLVDYDLRYDEARAISNEFLDGDAVISLDAGTVLIIVTPKENP